MRNGFYTRQMIDASNELSEIEIQRLRCRCCNASHSLLYDFLIPYRKYSLKALKEGVCAYIEQANSYVTALTEPIKEVSTLFDVVERMLKNLPYVWMRVVMMLIGAGVTVDEIAQSIHSPNSFKCKRDEKRSRMDWAAQVLRLVPGLFEVANREGYPMFAYGRGCKLLRTHSSECKLF